MPRASASVWRMTPPARGVPAPGLKAVSASFTRQMERAIEMQDRYGLARFVAAQDQGGTYEAAVDELRAGSKRSHWMWFVFPQIAGLGQTPVSRRYAISSLAEARAYLAHPVLGRRLIECTRIVKDRRGRSAQDVFGGIDALKLRSSMTLFARADPANPIFGEVLDAYFDGAADELTERLLEQAG
jgi:uncharacterized protein (DUF1810 family)